jgi:hypothetical protein
MEFTAPDCSKGWATLVRIGPSDSDTYVFKPRGLDVGKTFRVTFDSTGETAMQGGMELVRDGLPIRLESMGPLSGFMSLVPYIGLPLAMIPPLFAALPLNAVPVYVLVVFTVGMLHLTALNLLYPKIVGSRVHLNPLVVTFSLMFWGFLWDAPGLLLAIPLTAGIKAVCDNVKGLRAFGKFLGD